MPGRQAKILSDRQVESLLLFASSTRNPDRDKLIALLSIKAGPRAAGVAKLTLEMVFDPSGDIGRVIKLRNRAAKKGSGRLVPLHPSLRAALVAWRRMTTDNGPVIRLGSQCRRRQQRPAHDL